jgi:hypothetical protein
MQTKENEAAVVYPLAVMLAASVKLSGTNDDDLMRARAAVAELVRHSDTLATAVSNLIAAGTVSDGYSQYVTDVTAALSAFGGAK